MRNLRSEASALARPGELVKVRENRGHSLIWGAWDCLYKLPDQKRGQVRFTLIHRVNTRFI